MVELELRLKMANFMLSLWQRRKWSDNELKNGLKEIDFRVDRSNIEDNEFWVQEISTDNYHQILL